MHIKRTPPSRGVSSQATRGINLGDRYSKKIPQIPQIGTGHDMVRNAWGTIPEVAAEIGVSPRTVRRMISRGEIEANRVGPRLIRVRWSSLDQLGKPLAVAA